MFSKREGKSLPFLIIENYDTNFLQNQTRDNPLFGHSIEIINFIAPLVLDADGIAINVVENRTPLVFLTDCGL